MNKEQLIEVVVKKTKLSKKTVNETIVGVINAITHALSKGDKVTLVGFGTFQVRSRKAREGRNPRTGAKLQIAARKSPVFVAGKSLRELVGARKAAAAGKR